MGAGDAVRRVGRDVVCVYSCFDSVSRGAGESHWKMVHDKWCEQLTVEQSSFYRWSAYYKREHADTTKHAQSPDVNITPLPDNFLDDFSQMKVFDLFY